MPDPRPPRPRLIERRLYARLAGLLALMVLAAATESLGLILLVPMLELVGAGRGSGAEILRRFGLDPQLEVLLLLFIGLVTGRAAIV